LVLHVRCLRDICNVLKKYIEEDKMNNFIEDILNVNGTSSSFKIVFREASEYMERKSDTKK